MPVASGGPPSFLSALANGTAASLDPEWEAHFYLYGAGLEMWNGSPDGMLGTEGGRPAPQRAGGLACPAWARSVAAAQHTAWTLERDPGGYWDERDARIFGPVRNDYGGSVFVVSGLRNQGDMGIWPLARALEERGVAVKAMRGQWDHAYPDARIFEGQDETHKRLDFGEILLRWFDRWLKEEPVDVGPAIQVQDTLGQWRDEPRWPPTDATPVVFHLAPGGALTRDEGAASGSATLCPPGGEAPLPPPQGCEASLRFASEPLDRTFRFAGWPALKLGATPAGTGGQLRATLSIATEEGEVVLRQAGLDLRLAHDGDGPRPVVPGAPLAARLQFPVLDAAVPPGGRILVDIALAPAANPSAGVYPRMDASSSAAPVRIALGGGASTLTLDAFERGLEAFFAPPGAARPGP